MPQPRSKSRRPSDRKPASKRSRERDDDFDPEYDRSATVAQLEARYGSAKAALNQVHAERVEETRRKRRLQEELDEVTDELENLRDSLGIAEGTELPEKPVVLSASDKSELESFRALGKLDDVKKKVEEHSNLTKAAAESKQKETLEQAAKLSGNWDRDVLGTYVSSQNLVLEIREIEKEGGKKEPAAFVRENKDGSSFVRLTDHVKDSEMGKKLLPALQAGSPEDDGTGAQGLNRFGTWYPQTGRESNTKGAPTAVLSSLGSRDVRPSALKGTNEK